jgi:hypothetical protein
VPPLPLPGREITVEPGLIGGEVNRLLAAYQRKHKLPTQSVCPPPRPRTDRDFVYVVDVKFDDVSHKDFSIFALPSV